MTTNDKLTAPSPVHTQTGPTSTSPSYQQDPYFLKNLTFSPTNARFFELIDQTFELQAEERQLLEDNGFVVTDRLAFEDFSNAYAWLHWKDLPVLITIDSLLAVVHQGYDQILMGLEEKVLRPKLAELLRATLAQLELEESTSPRLTPFYQGLKLYLGVPLALLNYSTESVPATGVEPYLQLIKQANTVSQVSFFGKQRLVDFTLFQPRGHYNSSSELQTYFQAISWLAQLDFCLAEPAPTNPTRFSLNSDQLIAALLLQQVMEQAGQLQSWRKLDQLLNTLVGKSDNTTLTDLLSLRQDLQLGQLEELLNLTPTRSEEIAQLLSRGDYGVQKICGQLSLVSPSDVQATPQPISFRLLGQRFVIDAWVMSELVFDRLVVGGEKVARSLPSPLDVMYVLGNDRAATHLQEELARYGYSSQLQVLRSSLQTSGPDFWTQNLYHRWLYLLQTLNKPTTETAYPQAMRRAVWADRVLHTQLASWSQLRHDTILYAKHSYTSMVTCEYPAGYVEPYPAFYAALQKYALAGQSLITQLLDESREASFSPQQTEAEVEKRQKFYQISQNYYQHLAEVACQLQTLAEKELRAEAFSPEEELFIKNTAICHLTPIDRVCAVVYEKDWDGWYPRLFPWQEDNPALIADVHTNPETDPANPLYPPQVLHVGTGAVATMLLAVDSRQGEAGAVYAGPSFTYYEVIEEGFPPKRLTDQQWRTRLDTNPGYDIIESFYANRYPNLTKAELQKIIGPVLEQRKQARIQSGVRPLPPQWTTSFRIASQTPPANLELSS